MSTKHRWVHLALLPWLLGFTTTSTAGLERGEETPVIYALPSDFMPVEVIPNELLATESGSPGRIAGAKKSAGASRIGKDFTPAGKRLLDTANALKSGGINKCENCGTDVVPGQKNQRGTSPPMNQRERDHIIPKSRGGDGTPSNGQVLCRGCNLKKSDKLP